jgi:hypothetical protein
MDKERANLLREIMDVLKGQGVERPKPDELDHPIKIRVWDAPYFEFAQTTLVNATLAVCGAREVPWQRDD